MSDQEPEDLAELNYKIVSMTVEEFNDYLLAMPREQRIKQLEGILEFAHNALHAAHDIENAHMLIGVLASRLGGHVVVSMDSGEEMGKVLLSIEEDMETNNIVINLVRDPL